jgi:site-specific DNA recombinase
MQAPKRAVIYTRISRDDSGEGKSNERQEEDCRAFARLRGWEVIDVQHDISISAYTGKARPGWARVMEMMSGREADVVIAWKLDRITRTVRELSDIIQLSRETGVSIATTDGDLDLSNETGKAVATILGAVAEMEVERKGARQKRANQQRRAEGKRWSSGWRSFGYELDGTIIPEEADLIRVAADDVLRGTPIREIARRWREAGIRTPRSAKGADGWTHRGVRSILLNPRNAGLNTYQGEVVGRGDWEPIFAEEVHVRLKAMLTDPSRRTNAGRVATNLLSGIAVCATCQEPVTGGTVGRTKQVDGRRVTTERVPVYKCPNDHLSTDRDAADALVTNVFALMVKFDVQSHQLMPINRQGHDAHALHREAERLEQDITGLAVSLAEGRITLAQMEVATAQMRDRLEEVQRLIAEELEGDIKAHLLKSENMHRFREMSTAEKREILSRTARISLHPKGRGKRNVPMKHQVEMDLVTHWKTGEERIIPALRERPKGALEVNIERQPRKRARGERAGRL